MLNLFITLSSIFSSSVSCASLRFPVPIQLVNFESCDSHVLEEMLFHFSKLLHPNHYILIDIMHNLVIKEQSNPLNVITG